MARLLATSAKLGKAALCRYPRLRGRVWAPGGAAAGGYQAPRSVVLAAPALKAARQAPGAEVLQVDGTHYAAFLDQHERVVAEELDFLRRHLLQDGSGEDKAA